MNIESLVNPSKIRKSRVEYLTKSETSMEFRDNLDSILEELDDDVYEWVPVGEQVNNQMIADITDNMTGVVENLTNISDAYLLQNYDGGCYNSSHEAADKILDSESAKMRFDGYKNGRSRNSDTSITFADKAHGQPKENFDVFVSPYSSGLTKQEYDFIQGRRGVGGMTALSHTKNGDKFVASAPDGDPESWTWTVIRQMKNGDYYYLTVGGEFPSFEGKLDCGDGIGEKQIGTVVKLYSYKFKTNPNDVTGNAFRRRLSRYLPNPVVPVEIMDCRTGNNSKYTYTGIKDEIRQNSSAFHNISDTINVTNIGQVDIDVYIKKHSTKIDDNQSFTNILTSQNETRVMISVNGQSHARYSKSNMKSDSGVYEAGDNMIVYAEFNEDTLEANNNVFNTGRDGFSDAGVEEQFMNTIYNFISGNDTIDKINTEQSEANLMDETVTIDGISRNFKETIRCQDSKTQQKTVIVDTEYDSWDERENTQYEINVLAGELDSYSITTEDNNLDLLLSPSFDKLDRAVCQVTVSDSSNEYSTTFVLEEEKQDRTVKKPESIESTPDCNSPIISLALGFNSEVDINTDNSHSAHTQGNKFEDFVEQWIKNSGENISAKGGANHPPDYLLENGPALEAKSILGFGRIPTNSSPPEATIDPSNPRLKKETAEKLRDSEKSEREMFYAIGSKTKNTVWICQGSVLFGEHNLEKITNKLRESADQISDEMNIKTTNDTNEVAKMNGIDSMDNINLRIRRMMSFDHPVNQFENTAGDYNVRDADLVLAVENNWFNNLTDNDKESIMNNEDLTVCDIQEKSAKLIIKN